MLETIYVPNLLKRHLSASSLSCFITVWFIAYLSCALIFGQFSKQRLIARMCIYLNKTPTVPLEITSLYFFKEKCKKKTQ